MNERNEHTVEVGDDVALVVYCATCARVLMDLQTTGNGIEVLAEKVAFEHWASYSKDHTVLLGDLHTRRMQMINHSGQFQDISDHD